jgi:hypothetical protein
VGKAGFPLQAELEKRWKKPVRVGNDADVAGYGAIKGHGVELVLTLGTGLGTALFTNGHLCPGLELGHHPWRKKGMTYEDYLAAAVWTNTARRLEQAPPGGHQADRSPLQLGPPLPRRRQHQEDRLLHFLATRRNARPSLPPSSVARMGQLKSQCCSEIDLLQRFCNLSANHACEPHNAATQKQKTTRLGSDGLVVYPANNDPIPLVGL